MLAVGRRGQDEQPGLDAEAVHPSLDQGEAEGGDSDVDLGVQIRRHSADHAVALEGVARPQDGALGLHRTGLAEVPIPVDEGEVGHVHTVLGRLLRMGGEAAPAVAREPVPAVGIEVGELDEGVASLGVEPGEDRVVALHDGMDVESGGGRGLAARVVDAAAVGGEAQAVEGALEGVATDAAVTEVGTQVGTEGVDQDRRAIGSAVQDALLAEPGARHDAAGLQIGGEREGIPAGRERVEGHARGRGWQADSLGGIPSYGLTARLDHWLRAEGGRVG